MDLSRDATQGVPVSECICKGTDEEFDPNIYVYSRHYLEQ